MDRAHAAQPIYNWRATGSRQHTPEGAQPIQAIDQRPETRDQRPQNLWRFDLACVCVQWADVNEFRHDNGTKIDARREHTLAPLENATQQAAE